MQSVSKPGVSISNQRQQTTSEQDKVPLITKVTREDNDTKHGSISGTSAKPSTYDVINNNQQSHDSGARGEATVDFSAEDFACLEDEILRNYLPVVIQNEGLQTGNGAGNDETCDGIKSGVSTNVSAEHWSVDPPQLTADTFTSVADINDVIFNECVSRDVIFTEHENEAPVEFFRTAPRAATTFTTAYQQTASIPRPIQFAALTMNLSFAGCGFLGIYHLGVAHAFAHHGEKLLMNVQKFGGASAGSLIAAALAVRGPDKEVIQRCLDFCYSLAESVQRKKLGVLTPRLSLLDPLQSFLLEMFPEDAHVIAKGRLFISVTEVGTRKNYIRSEFDSKEQLIQYLLGSSYVPRITGRKPIKIDGKKYMDGGMTDNLPTLPAGRTVMITPFAGNQDICPVDKRGLGWFLNIQGEDFQVNKPNLRRGLHAFFPPKRKYLDRYFQRGKDDAMRFLKRERFYSETEVT